MNSVYVFKEVSSLSTCPFLAPGVVPPSPACERALRTVVDALRKDGHDVKEL